jgi:TPR repeat protein
MPADQPQRHHAKGEGVARRREATKWYRKAAEHGIAEAQNNLGHMYYGGEGVPQDYAEATKWYRKAAEQGNAKAQGSLGFIYLMGRGVPKDYVISHMWFNLAGARFSASERKKREIVEHYMDIVDSKMTPAQIAEAQRLAREWKPKKEK